MATTQTTDRDLLAGVIRDRNSDAFTQIVQRYLGLVYHSAQRQVGASAADDVTQAVFLVLWQRASHIRDGANLAGWLLNATRLVAMQTRREEQRRRRREQVAAANRPLTTGDSVTSSNDPISPLLDEAMGQLNEAERTAIALRYLQDKSLAEVAATVGVSEAAVTKRVSRGLGRLRRLFDKRGLKIPAAAIAAALQQHASRAAPPPAMGGQIVSSVITGGNPASAALARSVIASMTSQKVTIIIGGILTAAVLLLGVWLVHNLDISGANPTASSAQANSDSRPAASSANPSKIIPIKVGVILSRATALANGADGVPRGYEKQVRIARDLNAPDIELYPLVEAGTEKTEPLAGELRAAFPGRDPIDAEDAEALKHLDVIVCGEVWDTNADLMNAVDAAVTSGVGLLNSYGLGTYHPGIGGADSAPVRLAGLTELRFARTTPAVACQVVTEHPILGKLFSINDLNIRAMGVYGILAPGTIPLVKVSNMDVFKEPGSGGSNDPRYVFYPVLVSSLGKGKIVGCNFAAYGPVPSTLRSPGRSKFFIRCVHWLAGRPVE